ncbi:DUF4167 domain-containing protein [Rhizosaccharibacter radicis]|uniref:DUF4167 domain-containing protein n=1 Tax=Rhizosaccharibacter radicis TaxID=2782605 RepID=UPI003BF5D815
MKRMRGRNHRPGGGGGGGGNPIRHNNGQIPLNRNHVFDSNGPDLRIRGTAQQLFEKYLQLGRDATSSGDRVAAEGYFQHAEHYFRILNAMAQAQQQNQSNQHHNQQHQRRSVLDLNDPDSDPLTGDQPVQAEDGETRSGDTNGQRFENRGEFNRSESRGDYGRDNNRPEGFRRDRDFGHRRDDRDNNRDGGPRDQGGRDGGQRFERYTSDRQSNERGPNDRMAGERSGFEPRATAERPAATQESFDRPVDAFPTRPVIAAGEATPQPEVLSPDIAPSSEALPEPVRARRERRERAPRQSTRSAAQAEPAADAGSGPQPELIGGEPT